MSLSKQKFFAAEDIPYLLQLLYYTKESCETSQLNGIVSILNLLSQIPLQSPRDTQMSRYLSGFCAVRTKRVPMEMLSLDGFNIKAHWVGLGIYGNISRTSEHL